MNSASQQCVTALRKAPLGGRPPPRRELRQINAVAGGHLPPPVGTCLAAPQVEQVVLGPVHVDRPFRFAVPWWVETRSIALHGQQPRTSTPSVMASRICSMCWRRESIRFGSRTRDGEQSGAPGDGTATSPARPSRTPQGPDCLGADVHGVDPDMHEQLAIVPRLSFGLVLIQVGSHSGWCESAFRVLDVAIDGGHRPGRVAASAVGNVVTSRPAGSMSPSTAAAMAALILARNRTW